MMDSSAPPATGVKDVYSPQETGLSRRWITLSVLSIVLIIVGYFLLTRVERFSAEFVLLAVPLLAAFRPSLSAKPQLNAPLRVALGVAVAVFPFWHLYKVLETSCAFPLCTRALPEGSVAFLNWAGARGTVLNHPNDGGYLEWELQSRQQIYADLQTPFLFSDRDIFRADQAFQDPTVLAGLVGLVLAREPRRERSRPQLPPSPARNVLLPGRGRDHQTRPEDALRHRGRAAIRYRSR